MNEVKPKLCLKDRWLSALNPSMGHCEVKDAVHLLSLAYKVLILPTHFRIMPKSLYGL